MRAVLTRVKSASVTIDGEVVGKIGQGFLILLGVGPEDDEAKCRYLAEKALSLRIFEDENGKMNLGLDAVNGQVMVVSQFTLTALYTLINDRVLQGKPTIISTNLTTEGIARRYNPQIGSRLRGNFRRVTFLGEDIRLKKGLGQL